MVGSIRRRGTKSWELKFDVGTDAVTRVLIETSDGASSWVTVGVGHNVIEASWMALRDSLTFGLRRQASSSAHVPPMLLSNVATGLRLATGTSVCAAR